MCSTEDVCVNHMDGLVPNTVLMVTMGVIHNASSDYHRQVFILIDPGATTTMMSEALAEELHLHVVDTRTTHWKLAAGQSIVEPTKIVKGILEGPYGSIQFYARTIRVVTHAICPVTLSPSDVQFLHESGHRLPIEYTSRSVVPDVLIGMDYVWNILSPETFHVKLPSGLMATHSLLGTVISGMSPSGRNEVLQFNQKEQQLVNNSLEDYYEAISSLEAIGISDSPATSYDDEANEEAVRNFHATTAVHEGRLRVRLPYRKDVTLGGDNSSIAYCRLMKQLTSPKIKPFLQQYDQIIKDQVAAGIIEVVREGAEFSEMIYYAPHQLVVKTKSATTKCRMVFDYSSNMKNCRSLNDILVPGPVKLPNIAKVHLLAREKAVIVTADVEKAFHMIELHPEDRDVTRFFWFKDYTKMTDQDNIEVYRFTRVPFGAGPSPWLLAESIEYHMDLKFPEMSTHVRDGLYVDNQLFVTDTEEEALRLSVLSHSAFADASMNLREYVSNRMSIIEALPEGFRAKDLIDSRILGVEWNTVKDEYTFRLDLSVTGDVYTRRSILSVTSAIYDPLGLVGPFLILPKSLVQKTWNDDLDWDDSLPTTLVDEWKAVAADLQDVTVQVPRSCIDYVNTGSRRNRLVIFCDASGIGTCAAAYVVSKDSMEMFSSRLLMGRSRLAPRDLTEMPRLELVAFQMGSCLSQFILENFKMNFESLTMFSDSQIVIDQLRNGSSDKMFVNNRLKKITSTLQDVSSSMPVYVRYVKSEDNPADHGTRGLIRDDPNIFKWFHGPVWLQSDAESWPTNVKDFEIAVQTDSVTINQIVENPSPKKKPGSKSKKKNIEYEEHPCIPFCTASTWDELCEAVIKFSRDPVTEDAFKSHCEVVNVHISTVTTNEVAYRVEVERFILKEHQRICGIPNPGEQRDFITDQYGLVRIRGRLGKMSEYADLSVEYPVVLKQGHPLVKLLAMHCHVECGHGMYRDTLAKLWSKYVIGSATSLVRQTVRRCLDCRRHHARIYSYPRSPQLPIERIEIRRPFEHIGLDYCGPFLVTMDHDPSSDGSTVKIWVCVITCFATRGIYLDIVTSLDTKEFTFMFNEFVNKRGCPSYVLSDNQRSFVLGADILGNMYEDVTDFPKEAEDHFSDQDYLQTLHDDAEFDDFLKKKNIRWEFITALSPWKAGIYERMVGKFKVSMYKAAPPDEVMSYRIFQNLVSSAEASINDRPLVCPTPGFEYITPRMLMEPMAAKPSHMMSTDMNDDDYTGHCLNSKKAVQVWLNKAAKKSDRWNSIWKSDWLNELRMRPVTTSVSSRQSLLMPRVGDFVMMVDDKLPRLHWSIGTITDLVYSEDGQIRSAYVVYTDAKTGSKRRTLRSTCRLACLEIFDDDRQALQEDSEVAVLEDEDESEAVQDSSPLQSEDIQDSPSIELLQITPPNRRRKEAVPVRRNPGRVAKTRAQEKKKHVI